MKFFVSSTFFFSLALALLPGCGGRIIDWTVDHFQQGCPVKQCLTRARSYIRSIRVYDEFTLLGGFSALWLSDGVREDYARLHAYMRGKSVDEEKAFWRRQLAENDHFVTFYVMSSNDIKIGESNAPWSVFLKVGEQMYPAVEIKPVDLSQEYELILDKHYTRFTKPYAVKFSAKDAEGNRIVNEQTTCIALEFRSLKKKFTFTWPVINRDFNACHIAC